MSYSRRLDNVLKQIEYVENIVNKDLIIKAKYYVVEPTTWKALRTGQYFSRVHVL